MKAPKPDRPRKLVAIGASLVLLGIALCVATDRNHSRDDIIAAAPGYLTFAALALTAYGLHVLGRSGPDLPRQ